VLGLWSRCLEFLQRIGRTPHPCARAKSPSLVAYAPGGPVGPRQQRSIQPLRHFALSLSEQCILQLRRFLQTWHPNDHRLLFATRNGTPWDANMLRKRRFRSLLRTLNIEVPKGNGFHAFRHTNAALMDRLRIPMKVRQERLGHSNPAITLGIYTHAVGEDSRAASGQLGSIVWGRNSGIPAPNGLKSKTA
jgi:hypothetical protein